MARLHCKKKVSFWKYIREWSIKYNINWTIHTISSNVWKYHNSLPNSFVLFLIVMTKSDGIFKHLNIYKTKAIVLSQKYIITISLVKSKCWHGNRYLVTKAYNRGGKDCWVTLSLIKIIFKSQWSYY